MKHSPDRQTILVLGVIVLVVLVGLLGRSLNRRHIRGRGVSAQAYVLRVDAQKDLRIPSTEVFYVVQLAIPRPDGSEIVAAITVFIDPPEPGWTVPVRYLERLGSTTKVAPTGPFTPVARRT